MQAIEHPKKTKSNTLATGLAMFSMFFGAGNVVFPLALGQFAQGHNIYAILGLLITAVGVPFLGLLAMTLFDGNYKHFFERIGKVPGFLVALIIMGLIGPFGAIPRCIALSFATIQLYVPSLSLPLFSFISCVLIFLFTYRKTKLLDVLGYILTPFLLGSVAIIIIKGFFDAPGSLNIPEHSEMTTFFVGLKEGYQTMDLLSAFFFSSIVLLCLKRDLPEKEHQNHKKMIFLTIKAGCIGMALLSLVYIGFSYIAAFNSVDLINVQKEVILGTIAYKVLGPYGSTVTSIAVALACLTTAIALAAVFAEYLQDITKGKIGYERALVITLIITFLFSMLNFTGIIAFLAPILQILYPALILLSVLNIAHKLYHFQPVKFPVLIVFILSLIGYFI